MKKNLTIVSVALYAFAYAQLPDTDIWLLDINSKKDSVWLSNPQNITKRTGYDNQPAFSPDGKYILYTSIRDEKQSDIYKYDLITKQTTQFTHTPTSEYSPTFMPDGKNISVVMVEPDSTQRLWKFPLNGGEPICILKEIDSVGYHCWMGKNELTLCIITEPMSLYTYNLKSSAYKKITDSVGRSIHYKNEKLYYLNNKNICSLISDKKVKEALKKDNSEDFNLISQNLLIMADNSQLFLKGFVTYGKDGRWKFCTDLSSYGIKKITRIAVSKDGKKLAIVAE